MRFSKLRLTRHTQQASHFLHKVGKRHTLFLCHRAIWCYVPDWQYHHWLKAFGTELLLHALNIKVAHPACTQASLGGCQAQMLGCYSHINVAMLFAIHLSHPALAHVILAYHIHRSCGKPLSIVAFTQSGLCLLAAHSNKLPWLKVNRRWRHAHTLHYVLKIGFTHLL